MTPSPTPPSSPLSKSRVADLVSKRIATTLIRPRYIPIMDPENPPKKNKVRGVAEFADSEGLDYSYKKLATKFNLSEDQVKYAITSDTDRTQKSSWLKRGNASKVSERDLDRVQSWLSQNDPECHARKWDELASDFG